MAYVITPYVLISAFAAVVALIVAVALFIMPAITLLLAFTNEWHGLLWPTVTPVGAPEDNLALYGHGIAFWIGSVGYSSSRGRRT
jgi:hypothetical protein